MTTHRMRWFVYAGGQRIPHTAMMRGQWGYDVECSCGGFTTRTGGATLGYIRNEIWVHKFQAADDRYGPDDTCDTCGVLAIECGHRRPETRDDEVEVNP